MEWIAEVMSGGLTGLFGSMFGAVVKFFQTKSDRDFKKSEWEYELKIHDKNLEATQKQFDNESTLIKQAGSFSGLTASIKADSKIAFSWKWVSAFKSLFRPLLTIGLIVLYYQLTKDIENKENIISLTGYMVSMAVAWWFGDRAFTHADHKNK